MLFLNLQRQFWLLETKRGHFVYTLSMLWQLSIRTERKYGNYTYDDDNFWITLNVSDRRLPFHLPWPFI